MKMTIIRDYWLLENYSLENGHTIKSYNYGLRGMKNLSNRINSLKQEIILSMTLSRLKQLS